MTTLDLATVLLLHKTSLLAGATALLLLWWRADRPPGVLAIAVSFLLLALGSLLAGLGEVGAIPPYVWQDTSIAIAVAAYGQLVLGARSLDQPVRRARWILLAAPAVLAVGLFTSLFQDNTIRATTFHVVGALAGAVASLGLARRARVEPLSSRLPLALALAVSSAVYALQVPLLLSGLATPQSIALGFSATMMLNFVVAALVVSMVRERREELQRRVSITDALTGVLNRHGFLSHVPDRIDPPGALMLFDLDHFKRINDRFGHAAGDLALQRFARLVSRHLGAGDVLARLGGEEFVVFLDHASGRRAQRLAETIRQALAASPTVWERETILLTTSIGVAEARGRPDRSRERLLAAADAALYRAKASGRDRVELARPEDDARSAGAHRLDRRASRVAV